MRLRNGLISLGVGVALALGVGAAPAQAATSWNLQYTPADMVGAHAWGTVGTRSDGRWTLTGNIRDSASDSHGARLEVWVVYDCGFGGERYEQLDASGYLAENRMTWNGDGDTTSMIAVREVLTEAGENWDWDSWVTIYGGVC
ncbi:hypothetical protein ACI2K4_23810 [Micromonospora sp. NPDC050397]|uniref:hypothetical protein n=1 Tax=Micromonospora sp. NPDC050397 TaxID=3364279 RepID=UPI00384BA621